MMWWIAGVTGYLIVLVFGILFIQGSARRTYSRDGLEIPGSESGNVVESDFPSARQIVPPKRLSEDPIPLSDSRNLA